MEIRSIIKEALIRANIVPRRQPAPDDKVESGFRLLKGLVAFCNKENYLSFTLSEMKLPARRVLHLYDKTDTMIGEGLRVYATTAELQSAELTAEDDGITAMAKDNVTVAYDCEEVNPGNYAFVPHVADKFNEDDLNLIRYIEATHVKIRNISKLNTLMLTNGVGANNAYTKLSFVPFDDFGRNDNNDLVWTWTPLSEGEYVVLTKPYVAGGAISYSLSYNKGIEFDIDSDLRIPDAFSEMLIAGLAYKLSVEFPRVNESKQLSLKAEFDKMVDNVKTPNADARQVRRDIDYIGGMTAQDVLAGRMLL